MTDHSSVIARDLAAAAEANRHHVAALLRFQAACISADWPAAETARLEVIASLESHLDHLAATYRRMRAETA